MLYRISIQGMICFLFSLFLTLPLYASHIVGGEFSLQYTGAVSTPYALSLNLYFDQANGNPLAEDSRILVTIYNKATQAQIDTFYLPKVLSVPLTYNNPACATGSLQTKLIRYARNIALPSTRYNQAEGYYVVWERCCRNASMINIANPGMSGTTFYMEFPAVGTVRNPVINSSPAFKPAAWRYACAGELFSVDFSASDIDKDSLVYSLVTPLRGNATSETAVPTPKPGPYASVQWNPGFSDAQMIAGTIPLRIESKSGQLSFQTNRLGLYVFGIRCEEYRNGKKIGEIRRDFQILVLACPVNRAPKLALRTPKGLYQSTDTLDVLPDALNCWNVLATDTDPNTTLSLRVQTEVVLAGKVTLSVSQGTVTGADDTLRSQLCIDSCLTTTSPVTQLQLIATDNGCPVGKPDTLQIRLRIKPAISTPPRIFLRPNGKNAFYIEGTLLPLLQHQTCHPVLAVASQKRLLSVALLQAIPGVTLGTVSRTVTGQTDTLRTSLCLNKCQLPPTKPLRIGLLATSLSCQKIEKDTLWVTVEPDYPVNHPPKLWTRLNGKLLPATDTVRFSTRQPLCLDMLVTDPDSNTTIETLVQTLPTGFSVILPKGMLLSTSDTLRGKVCTTMACIPAGKPVRLSVIVTDRGCGPAKTDTLLLVFKPEEAVNYAPVLMARMVGSEKLYTEGSTISLKENTPACIELLATDTDIPTTLQLVLNAQTLSGIPLTVNLKPGTQTIATPTDTLRATVCLPTCIGDKPFTLTFVTTDNACTPRKDTLQIQFMPQVSPNTPPILTTSLPAQTAHLILGEKLTFDVTGTDTEGDTLQLTISLVGPSFPPETLTSIASVQAKGKVQTQVLWQTDCSIPPGVYEWLFTVTDRHGCQKPDSDTLKVTLHVQDKWFEDGNFLPPNVFTPNEDGKNTCFEIPDLPADNCSNYFKGIKIYNRWGKPVFSDSSRSFQWCGQDFPTGIYFYQVHYSQTSYKGTVTLIR